MVDDSEIALSDEDVEALRKIIRFARDKSGLGIKRQDLSNAAEIRGGDLDNFISKDKAKGGYKTQRPRNRVLLRLMRYVCTDARIRGLIDQGSAHKEAIERIVRVYSSLKTYSPDDDHLFLYINRIKAMDVQKCRATCSHLSGNYYGYRFSANKNKIIKSHFEIKQFDPTRKIPNFVHHLKYANKITRLTLGQVMEIGNHYVFMGYVMAGTYEYEGVKFIVVPKGPLGAAQQFLGPFVSYDGSIHETGFIQLMRTKDKYDADKIGEFSIDQLRTSDPLFDPKALRFDIATRVDIELNEAGNIQHAFLVGSIAPLG